MAQIRKRLYLQAILISLCVAFTQTSWSQETSPTFQESRMDILNVLKVEPTPLPTPLPGRRPKGFQDILPDDYSKLVANPTTRSLILFDFDSAEIKPESYSILKNYSDVLQEDLPGATVVIAGHTDSIGDDTYNLELSKRRAKAVKDFLVEMYGIAANRLVILFYGESQPIASNDSDEGRSWNRRVEFIRVQ